MPNFEMPKMEIPAEFREFAENSASQVRETFERMKSAAEAASDVIEETFATSTKGASDYGLKVIDATRVNTSAAFDFYAKLMTMESLSDVVELANRTCAQAVRGCHCTIGTRGAHAKGHDRDLEADDGKLDQDERLAFWNVVSNQPSMRFRCRRVQSGHGRDIRLEILDLLDAEREEHAHLEVLALRRLLVQPATAGRVSYRLTPWVPNNQNAEVSHNTIRMANSTPPAMGSAQPG